MNDPISICLNELLLLCARDSSVRTTDGNLTRFANLPHQNLQVQLSPSRNGI